MRYFWRRTPTGMLKIRITKGEGLSMSHFVLSLRLQFPISSLLRFICFARFGVACFDCLIAHFAPVDSYSFPLWTLLWCSFGD